MNLAEWLAEYQQRLHKIYDKDEVYALFLLTVKELLYYSRMDFILHQQTQLDVAVNLKFKKTLIELIDGKPIQYVFGHSYFYGLQLKVNSNVLIPRPETEELVQWIIDIAKSKTETLSILDIGTGTGCIAISLAENIPDAKVYAIDVSKKALIISKMNSKLNKVDVEFFELDILNWKSAYSDLVLNDLQFDIIVSNPPYVRELEKAQMSANVLRYEPDLALYVEDEEPLIFYKAITEFAAEHLTNNGQLFFEINQYLGAEMLGLLDESDFTDVELKKDIFGNDRMVSGTKIS